MTTYRTGNPIGSIDPKDLYDNAENLDDAVNGSAQNWTDRFGRSRRSLQGFEDSATVILAQAGYLVPVPYAAGLSMETANQTVSYGGETYAPIQSELPFTTSGTFESGKFRLIQGISGPDLALPTGGAMVGFARNTLARQVSDVTSMLSAQAVSLWEFADQIADRSNPDPSLWDWTAATQAAADYCFDNGLKLVIPPYSYQASGPIYIRGNLDGTGATFSYPVNYTGIGFCVGPEKSDLPTTRTSKLVVRLPTVVGGKSGTGWAGVSGSVGVLLVNIMESEVHVGEVRNFDVGVRQLGNRSDCNYNSIYFGRVVYNRINFDIYADGSVTRASCNQNNYYGGRFALAFAEGVRVPGTSLIRALVTGSTSSLNNNVFHNPSVEGPADESAISLIAEDGGSLDYNIFIDPRTESGGESGKRIYLSGSNCRRNQFIGGYGLNPASLVEENGAASNSIDGPLGRVYRSTGSDPTLSLGNTSSNNYLSLAVFPTTVQSKDAGNAEKASVGISAAAIGVRAAGTEGPNYRWRVVAANGRHEWSSDVSVTPDTTLYRQGPSALKTDGKFYAVGGLGVGNAVAATEVIGKAVVRKIQVFDENGSNIGFVPVYSSIT